MLVIFFLVFKNQRLQNMDKEELQNMLNNLSETELSTLGDLINKVGKKPRNRRRGKGKRKTKKIPQKPKTNVENMSSELDFINNLGLSPEETRELESASKFDRERGLDRPKSHDTILSKGPSFKKISIKCMDCNKMFDIAPALVPLERDRFRCNNCSCRGRGRT